MGRSPPRPNRSRGDCSPSKLAGVSSHDHSDNADRGPEKQDHAERRDPMGGFQGSCPEQAAARRPEDDHGGPRPRGGASGGTRGGGPGKGPHVHLRCLHRVDGGGLPRGARASPHAARGGGGRRGCPAGGDGGSPRRPSEPRSAPGPRGGEPPEAQGRTCAPSRGPGRQNRGQPLRHERPEQGCSGTPGCREREPSRGPAGSGGPGRRWLGGRLHGGSLRTPPGGPPGPLGHRQRDPRGRWRSRPRAGATTGRAHSRGRGRPSGRSNRDGPQRGLEDCRRPGRFRAPAGGYGGGLRPHPLRQGSGVGPHGGPHHPGETGGGHRSQANRPQARPSASTSPRIQVRISANGRPGEAQVLGLQLPEALLGLVLGLGEGG
mmetsp:Transcript_43778/g.78752  ORF Transcript_43778/g.78752 Transcript_43778/m.78752 type:complete len:376 (+) Transcript_43778:422-1549(+)